MQPMQHVPFVDLKAEHAQLQTEVATSIAGVLEFMELLHGPNGRAFEAEFASYCRSRYALGVGSGSDALYLALRACGVSPGDEVITVSFTVFATVEAILRVGAVPVYVDIDPATYTMDPALVEPAIGPRTRAILPVHLYGQMADMEGIVAIAQRHGLAVIEDACQAVGAESNGRRAGSIGDAAAFSFHPGKLLSAYGEAGAVATNSRAVADEVRLLREHGSAGSEEHSEIGINSRLDELQAAVLRVKLQHLDAWTAQRGELAQLYGQLLHDLPAVLPSIRAGASHVFQHYVVQVEERDRVREVLGDRGISTEVQVTHPVHVQPATAGTGRIAGDLQVTEVLWRRMLSLPIFPQLTPAQLAYVAAGLREQITSPI